MTANVLRASTTTLLALTALVDPASANDAKSTYSLFRPTPDSVLRDMSTDRPDKTESAYTVDAGRIQVETDLVAYTRDREDGISVETLDVMPFNFKLGLTHDTDLQIIYASFSRIRVDGPGGFQDTESGAGDLVVRLQRNIRGTDSGRTAPAAMAFVKLPTSTFDDANDDVEGGIIVPLALDLGNGMGLGLMTEVDFLRSESDGGYQPSFINSATVSFELTKELGMYLEIFTERSAESDANTVVTFDAGFTYAVTDNLQLDFGANIGVTDVADDLNVFAGLSRRF